MNGITPDRPIESNPNVDLSHRIHKFIMASITVQIAFLCSIITMTVTGVILCIAAGVFTRELDLLVYQPAEISDINLDGVKNYNLFVQLRNYLAVNGSLLVIAGLIGFAATAFFMRRRLHLVKISLLLVIVVMIVNTILVPSGAFKYGGIVDTFEADLSQLVRDYNGRFHNAKILGPIKYSTSRNETSIFLDQIQFNYQCCGVNGGADFSTESVRWNTSRTIKLTDGDYHLLLVPPTCCKPKNPLNENWSTGLANGKLVDLDVDSDCVYKPPESPGCYEVIDKKLKLWAHVILFLFFSGTCSQVGHIVSASIWIYTRTSKKDRTVSRTPPSSTTRDETAGQPTVQTSDEENLNSA